MDVLKNALLVAYSKGYFITDEGNVLNPNGNPVKHLTRKGIPYKYFNVRVDGVGMRRVMIHRLQAYQKYGDRIFEDGIVVRHLNSNPEDNSRANISIGSQSENVMDRHPNKRIDMAIHASSFIKKYDHELVSNFYKSCKSYKKTMAKFNISSKSTLHFILNKH